MVERLARGDNKGLDADKVMEVIQRSAASADSEMRVTLQEQEEYERERAIREEKARRLEQERLQR